MTFPLTGFLLVILLSVGLEKTHQQSLKEQDCDQLPVLICPQSIEKLCVPAKKCGLSVFFPLPIVKNQCPKDFQLVQVAGPANGTFISATEMQPKTVVFKLERISAPQEPGVECAFEIYVRDCFDPEIVCPAAVLYHTSSRSCYMPIPPQPTISDNCPNPVLQSITLPSESDPYLGNQTILWRAMDSSGNKNECIQLVERVDSFVPSLRCLPSVLISLYPPQWIKTVEPILCAVASDNCGPPSLSATPSSVNIVDYALQPLNLEVTAIDTFGNRVSCTTSMRISGSILVSPHVGQLCSLGQPLFVQWLSVAYIDEEAEIQVLLQLYTTEHHGPSFIPVISVPLIEIGKGKFKDRAIACNLSLVASLQQGQYILFLSLRGAGVISSTNIWVSAWSTDNDPVVVRKRLRGRGTRRGCEEEEQRGRRRFNNKFFIFVSSAMMSINSVESSPSSSGNDSDSTDVFPLYNPWISALCIVEFDLEYGQSILPPFLSTFPLADDYWSTLCHQEIETVLPPQSFSEQEVNDMYAPGFPLLFLWLSPDHGNTRKQQLLFLSSRFQHGTRGGMCLYLQDKEE